MRLALGIEYDGTGFYGWQRLTQGPSVQAAVEKALSFVANEPVEIICAGRTDTGVHAHCQVVHFDTDIERATRSWVLGACSNLPREVAVLWAQVVADDFNARFDARARRYRYTILNRPIRAALESRYVTWARQPLDAEAMHEAAQALVGEHDFTSFRALSCQARHARRNVHDIRVWREGERVMIEIQANAFLHHMVRNIVGSLLPIGRGEKSRAWMGQLLAGLDRSVAGPTAPASGLTFIGPRYPRRCGLPEPVTLSSATAVG